MFCRGDQMQRGFTLIETLVTLLIVSLVMSVLALSLSQSFDLLQRSGDEAARVSAVQMRADWFRTAVHGLQPEEKEGPHEFRGEQRRLAGLSTSVVGGAEGAAEPFSLEIKRGTRDSPWELRLSRHGSGAEVPVLSWEGSAEGARFEYLDESGKSYDTWPPPFASVPQLPHAIALVAQRDGAPWRLYAVVNGSRRTPVEFIDIFDRAAGAPR